MKKTKMTLTPEQLNTLKRDFHRTWDRIASDAGRCSNIVAIELCLDADRFEDASKEARDIVDELLNVHGYDKTLKALAKLIQVA